MASLFPHSVAAAESAFGDQDVGVWAEEAPAVMHAVPKRRREFAAGRLCARAALVQLGHAPVAIARDADRAPVWPQGLVGSITHCEGFAAAAVASASDYRTLGIDVEHDGAVPLSVASALLTPEEVDHMAALPSACRDWRTLFFSAKEAVYKALFPLTREFLDAHAVRIQVDPDGQRFEARILAGTMRSVRVPGRYALRQFRIHTASWLLR